MISTLNDNILSLISASPHAIVMGVAERVKKRRIEMNYTQAEISRRSGIPISTYRRFERTGKIAFDSLVMIGMALGTTEDFAKLFSAQAYQNIEQMQNSERNAMRKRARP